MSYSGYPSSGIGNAALITASRADDLTKTFTQQSSGNLYLSCQVNVTGETGAGAYFLAFTVNGTSTSYTGRLWVRISGTSVNFGLSKSSEAATYSSTTFSLNTTYLLVLKYAYIDGATNDPVSLFVFTDPNLPATEPVTPEISLTGTGITDNNLGAVLLRQASGLPDLTVDGIRIATSWSEAPLPVELTSFSASVIGSTVKLSWQTATEINNFGFEILRQGHTSTALSVTGWERLGFVNGNGNSNSPKNYSFVDDNVTAGTYSYRLKQIDNDGQFEYSKTIEVDLGTPKKFELSQNYPNPFNPSTTINYNLPEAANVKLIIYNILGQEIKTLVKEFKEAGVHTVNFNASELNSGLYIYKIEAGSFTQTRKMTLIK